MPSRTPGAGLPAAALAIAALAPKEAGAVVTAGEPGCLGGRPYGGAALTG
ncbi:hypothetical protein ABZZ74_36670 [Streptomyces sp. NPDC006476]